MSGYYNPMTRIRLTCKAATLSDACRIVNHFLNEHGFTEITTDMMESSQTTADIMPNKIFNFLACYPMSDDDIRSSMGPDDDVSYEILSPKNKTYADTSAYTKYEIAYREPAYTDDIDDAMYRYFITAKSISDIDDEGVVVVVISITRHKDIVIDWRDYSRQNDKQLADLIKSVIDELSHKLNTL